MKKAILIQSRLSSSRFPKKMIHNIIDITLVEYVYNRCKNSKEANEVIVITSDESSDDELYELCISKSIPVYRGDLDNVLKRYIDASLAHNVDIICRVCGDSPFVDTDAIDSMLQELSGDNLDYMVTTDALNGFLSEVFTLDLLQKIYNSNLTNDDKEHVTKYIRDNIEDYNTKEYSLELRVKDLEKYTLTIDYPKDMDIAKTIVRDLDGFDFTSKDIIKILKDMKDK
jgi:spore coat polysaccharide biosynthesis protein SpsF (cytidylyltransferase family)